MQERLDTDMKAAALSIKKSKVLTMHGTMDDVIPVGDARQFSELISNHELVEVEGADHMFSNPAHAEMMAAKVADFIGKA